MATKKTPGRAMLEGPRAFKSSATPSGRRVPFVDVASGGAGGIRGSATSSAPSGRKVPDWRK
jgi:hypothetical protein